jgi:hypothetical protein
MVFQGIFKIEKLVRVMLKAETVFPEFGIIVQKPFDYDFRSGDALRGKAGFLIQVLCIIKI